MEALNHQINHDAIRAVANARQIVLNRCDHGKLTAAERNAEMDLLDNQVIQLALRATRTARNAVLLRDQNGELTFAERAAELGALDSRLALILHSAATQGSTDPKSNRRSTLLGATWCLSDFLLPARLAATIRGGGMI